MYRFLLSLPSADSIDCVGVVMTRPAALLGQELVCLFSFATLLRSGQHYSKIRTQYKNSYLEMRFSSLRFECERPMLCHHNISHVIPYYPIL